MEKIITLLKKLGVELTADQQKQLEEVGGKEFVAAAEAAKTTAELEGLKKQLEQRNADLEKLKANAATSDELKKQLDDLQTKYTADTDELKNKLTAQETDFAAERFLDGFKFASVRVRRSVAADFKAQGFVLKDGKFVGGEEYIKQLQESEPASFAQEQKPGLFMGSTQSNVGMEQNNLQATVGEIFGNK